MITLWEGLVGALHARDERGTGARLLARWAEPHRRYHDLAHLGTVLRGVDDLAACATNPDLVRLAAWYHDAVYRGRPDDEEASARLAERELPGLGLSGPSVAEVARLVRLTAGHITEPGDANGEVLCDADLAILASPGPDYATYVEAVRAEYAHVPEAAFRAGRAKVLRGLLELPSLYRTAPARRRWEAAARENLARELSGLR